MEGRSQVIVYLQGILKEASPLSAVILTGGVGYGVHLPVRVAEKLPAVGCEVSLHIRQVFREDASDLYGFIDVSERDFFDLLIKVSGIGPKTGLALLSRVDPGTLVSGISTGDTTMLAKCPGIGKKTAERIVVELRDKVPATGITPAVAGAIAPLSGSPTEEEAVAALTTLGFKVPDARKAVAKAAEQIGANASTEDLVKAALR